MSHQTGYVSDNPGETSQSSPSQNTTYHDLHNNTSHSCLNHNGLNSDLSQQLNDTVKYVDYQNMLVDQRNTMMDLKMAEYEKALAERENTIISLHTDMMNSKKNNNVLISQYKNIMDKTKSVSDTCNYLNTNFTNICERFNILGDTVVNVKTGQREVMELVNRTTNAFEEKFLSLSDNIEDTLKQANIEEIRAKQELEILENKYSHDLIAYKTNIEEVTNEMNNLKAENVILLGKLNETNMILNKEKEITFNLNEHFEKQLKLKEDHNVFLINQNKSINFKLDEIQLENQSFKDEVIIMKNALEESENNLDKQLTKIKEQTELIDMFKVSEVLNETLKKDNCTLKDRNEYLEKINTDLMDDISNKEISINKIQEEKEDELKKKCINYDDLIKIQEEKLMDITQQLELQKEIESKICSEVLDLKHEIEARNDTIVNLQNEGKASNILTQELQSKINNLNENLNKYSKKLKESSNDFVMEKKKLETEKIALEHQNQEHFKNTEKLTMSYMKYKSKAKQLYIEVMRLRSLQGQKNAILPPTETFELLNDCDENNIGDNDISVFEFNDQNNMDVSMRSLSSKVNQNANHSNIKRNSPCLTPFDQSILKKRRTVENLATSQKHVDHIQNTKENNMPNKTNLKLTPLTKKFDANNEVNNQTVNLNITSNLDSKKTFRIPADLQSPQKKKKPTKMQKNVKNKSNSPVIRTILSTK